MEQTFVSFCGEIILGYEKSEVDTPLVFSRGDARTPRVDEPHRVSRAYGVAVGNTQH